MKLEMVGVMRSSLVVALLLVAGCMATEEATVAAGAEQGAGAGLRALVVFPVPGRSHSIVGHSLVDILLQDGFEVTFVTPYPRENPAPGLTYINISSVVTQVSGGEKLNMSALAVSPRPPHAALRIGPMFTARALRALAMQDFLADTDQHFDLVIAEWFFSKLLAPLAAIYKAPLVWYSAADVSWQTLELVHEPCSPAYTVDLQSRRVPTQPFSFWDRTYQLGMQLYLSAWTYYIENYVEVPLLEECYGGAVRARGGPALGSDAARAGARPALLLLNTHPPLGQRPPLPHNAFYVGGHHLDLPPKPLTQDLQQLLDEAEHGAIFFSMGSNLKSTDFPERMKRELVEIFGQLKQTVLWKFEETLDNLPSNLHILDWAPQTSILNHPNVKLFITHGGLLSQIEATQFGVPLVGIPLFGDQFVNVDLAVIRGCALRVDFTPNLPNELKDAINKILGNNKFSSCAARSAAEFSSRVASPQAQVAALARGAALRRLPAAAAAPAAPARGLGSRLPLELAVFPLALLLLLALLRPLLRALTHTPPPHVKQH